MVAEALPQTERTPVLISAADPVTAAGIATVLRTCGVRETSDPATPGIVGLVVVDHIDADVLATVRSLRSQGAGRILLLASRIDDKGVLSAVEAGATGVLRRSEATPTALKAAVRSAAAGDGMLPPDLLGRLLAQVGQLQRQVLHPRGLTFAGLTEREIGVLRLLAEGCDTAEVGRRLFYSERTVKNIIHDVTSRLELRNRTHAVAYAIREGLI
jgi:DNA-binding NarL/FixJ family response regulator